MEKIELTEDQIDYPKPNHKWFLCIEAGGCLDDEEFIIEAKSLDEAVANASMWNASVIRELKDKE
jgi:hypothetical protein